MLSVNCPKPDVVIETFKDKEIEGIKFEYVMTQGLSVILRSNDDNKAKAVVKKILAELPALKYKFTSVMLVDDQGRAL